MQVYGTASGNNPILKKDADDDNIEVKDPPSGGASSSYFCYQCGLSVCSECRLLPEGINALCTCILPPDRLEPSSSSARMSSIERQVLIETILSQEEVDAHTEQTFHYCEKARREFEEAHPTLDPSDFDDLHLPIYTYTSQQEPPTLEEYRDVNGRNIQITGSCTCHPQSFLEMTGREENAILDDHYELIRNRLAGVNKLETFIEGSNPDSNSLNIIVNNWGNMSRAPRPWANPKKELKPGKGFEYHPLVDMCFNNSAHVTLVLEADALNSAYAEEIMRQYQYRGLLISTPDHIPMAPSVYLGVKRDTSTDVALLYHFHRHQTVRPKNGGPKQQMWACHGAICRISFGLHSTIPQAREWIQPYTDERLNREGYCKPIRSDPLNNLDPDKDAPKDSSYLAPTPWVTTSDTTPTPVLVHWQGLLPNQELTEGDLESYAEIFTKTLL